MFQQQQQQHSILSQASWGRLEMKPKRDEKTGRHIKGQKEHKIKRGHGSDTLIANLQALLSIAKQEIHVSRRYFCFIREFFFGFVLRFYTVLNY
jgi:hypothetical protein